MNIIFIDYRKNILYLYYRKNILFIYYRKNILYLYTIGQAAAIQIYYLHTTY